MASLSKLSEKLCTAVEQESSVDVRILLEHGADPLAFSSNGMNAIGLAASNGNVGILKRLLEHVYNEEDHKVERRDSSSGSTSTFRNIDVQWMETDAVVTPEGMGDLEWDEEIDTDRVYSPDKEWLDLYSYYARMWENIGQVLDTACELKDVHCLDRQQMAPIHYAAKYGHINCLKLLLVDYKSPVDIQTYSGQTALHLACEYQHHRIVKCLLQHGASVNLKTFKVEDTALLKAAKNGNNRICQILLDHGASINMCNAYDVSPLIGATFFGHHETVKLLVERGANVNLKDRDGLTALVIAVHNEATETTRCLLSNGARVIPTHNLVHTAINLDNEEILRMLILAGENVTRGKDSYGLTPIDKIIQRGNLEMLHFSYEYFRLDVDTHYESGREILMALHCDDVGRFRRMLNFFLNMGRSIEENDVLLMGIKLRRFGHVRILLQENVEMNTDWNEEVVEMLKKDTADNLSMLMHLVAAGFRIHTLPALRSRWTTGVGNSAVDQYLHGAYTNPLSLQDLSRIKIRTILRDTVKTKANSLCDRTRHDQTPFERALWSCGLPTRLVRYLHEFYDLSSSAIRMDWGSS